MPIIASSMQIFIYFRTKKNEKINLKRSIMTKLLMKIYSYFFPKPDGITKGLITS